MKETLLRPSTTESRSLAFDTQLVINEWQELSSLEGKIPPAEFAELYIQFQQEQTTNLETNIGERFNAVLFEVNYPVKNNRLANPFREEYALDTIINGQQHRLGESTNLNHDQLRELAEIVSFSATETHLINNPNDVIINPSPIGGNYKNNFVDIFEMDQGTEVVRMRRLAVSASLQEHIDIAQRLTGEQLSTKQPADIELKSIVISTNKSFEEISSIYLPDKKALSLEEYQQLIIAYEPWRESFMQAVLEGKTKKILINILLRGNKAMDIFLKKDFDATHTIKPHTIYRRDEIPFIMRVLEPQPVREVKTGCGIQEGSIVKRDLIFTSLFGPKLTTPLNSLEQEDVKDFRCPGKKKDGSSCTYIVRARSGVSKCPECGLEATCA